MALKPRRKEQGHPSVIPPFTTDVGVHTEFPEFLYVTF